MPYRIDLPDAGAEALDRLIELGAIDLERGREGGVSALMPDGVEPGQVVRALGVVRAAVFPAVGRDADSVWVLTPRPVRVGRLRIVPASMEGEPGAVRLIDAPAFGTGLHPTTALCLELIDEIVQTTEPASVLDIGTGSGVLALAALRLGVRAAVGLDVDDEALRAAAENARLNAMHERLRLARGGPESITGTWPLVVANVQAAPLVEMAPSLVSRVGHQGDLVLSGLPTSLEHDVARAYRDLGMYRVSGRSRGGWIALVLRASW